MSDSVRPDREQPTVPGILQARILEWVAISFSNAWKQKVKVKSLSHVWLLVTPWTTAYQAPPSMGFSKQEYWNEVPLPSPIILWRRHISYLHFLKHHIRDLTNIFCKVSNSKHLSLCGSYGLYHRLAIVTPKQPQTIWSNGHGCVLIKLYLQK